MYSWNFEAEKMRDSQEIRRWVSEYISCKMKAHACIRFMIAVMLCSRVLAIIALIFSRRLLSVGICFVSSGSFQVVAILSSLRVDDV